MNRGNLIVIHSYEALDPDKPDDKEACINICRRAFGKGYRVVIPLSRAYEYVETNELIAKAVEFAHVLYQGLFNRGQVVNICDTIDNALYDLLNSKPAPERSKNDLENEMDRLGIVFTLDGKRLIDAS